MTDNEIKRAIRKYAPGLNKNAAARMLFGFKFEATVASNHPGVPMPTDEAEVAVRVKKVLDDVQKWNDKIDDNLRRRRGAGSIPRTTSVDLLNDSADELAFEAAAS